MIIKGDCIEQMKLMKENSVDAIVTDPPYGLEFMGKHWDKFGKGQNIGGGTTGKDTPFGRSKPLTSYYQYGISEKRDMQNFFFGWAIECLRILKPGGFLLAMGGTRTYHRLVCGIEDAGFEIRDTIMWLYGCLSEDTEVLTINGWEHYHKNNKFIKNKEPILIYDNQKNNFKWELPEMWQDYILNKDTCYRIKSDNTDQLVSRNHRCLVEREGKLLFKKAEELNDMENMPTLSNNFLQLDKEKPKILLQEMQRILQRTGMEEVGKDRSLDGNSRNEKEIYVERSKESSMERRSNLLQEERKLWEIQNKVCSLSSIIYSYGEKGWLCNGTPINNSKEIKKMLIENRSNTSQRPQSREQSNRESNIIQNKQGTQDTRGIRIEKAKVTKEEYSGLVFCPTVSTGCFVARRNGKIFITGNSGFPKSLNIGKQIDKLQGNKREDLGKAKYSQPAKSGHHAGLTDKNVNFQKNKERFTPTESKGNSEWEGWGTALKPACEPIVVARKPLSEKNVALNVLKWGTGGINIDGCRIEGVTSGSGANMSNKVYGDYKNKRVGVPNIVNTQGRFPANIILDEEAGKLIEPFNRFFYCAKASKSERNFGVDILTTIKLITSKDIEILWKEENMELAQLLLKDILGLEAMSLNIGESGENIMVTFQKECLSTIKMEINKITELKTWNSLTHLLTKDYIQDVLSKKEDGSNHAKFVENLKKLMMKTGISQEKVGLLLEDVKNVIYKLLLRIKEKEEKDYETNKNFHPTVKSLKLMEYLVKLVSREGATVLDPFLGSGTTGIACAKLNRRFIGIEKEEEYIKIAEARIKPYLEQEKL